MARFTILKNPCNYSKGVIQIRYPTDGIEDEALSFAIVRLLLDSAYFEWSLFDFLAEIVAAFLLGRFQESDRA